jgi:hypothetical protein
MTVSIFDQFEITQIVNIHPFGNFDISITNSTIFMVIALGLFIQLSRLTVTEGKIVPDR